MALLQCRTTGLTSWLAGLKMQNATVSVLDQQSNGRRRVIVDCISTVSNLQRQRVEGQDLIKSFHTICEARWSFIGISVGGSFCRAEAIASSLQATNSCMFWRKSFELTIEGISFEFL